MPELPTTDDVNEWTDAIGPNGIPRINITAPVSAAPSLPVENQTNYIVEPDLIEAQQGKVALPPDVALNDAGIPFNKTTGKEIPVVRRPNVLPIAQKDESGNTIFAMPKMLDIFGSVMSPLAAPAVATKAGEVVLGSGAIRTMPEVAKAAEPTGPFYSTLAQAVDNSKINKATPDQWIGYLKNQPGVKAEEINTVLKDLPEGPITKEALQGIVNQNGVKLNEVHYGTGLNPQETQRLNQLDQASSKRILTDSETKEIEALLEKQESQSGKPFRYSQYQLPGGENYQEMLMTLPDRTPSYKLEDMKPVPKTDPAYRENPNIIQVKTPDNVYEIAKSNRPDRKIETFEDAANYVAQTKKPNLAELQNYKSSHWDEPNIVAHVRYNDRNVEGAKTLHLEEVQSDWHQAGRKQGYIQKDLPDLKSNADIVDQKLMDAKAEDIMANPDLNSGLKDAVNRKIISQKEADDYLRLTQNEHSKIPDAPFKKNWDELALKRMLHKAATEGYDAISWTPGEAQAARYDLSKQVRGIHWQPSPADKNASLVQINPTSGDALKLQVDKTGKVVATFPSSQGLQFEGKNLADVVGKEHAEKILEKEKGSLEGEGLKIGGEGMKSFYDKMLIDKANALAKKYGAKVENNVPLGYKLVNKYGIESKGGKTLEEAQKNLDNKVAAVGDKNEWQIVPENPIHVLKLTPELKARAKQGFPLFSSVPVLNPVDFDPFERKYDHKSHAQWRDER